MATMYVPAHTVDVDDPQPVVADAIRQGLVHIFCAMHDDRDPENPIVMWIMRQNDGCRLEWIQSEAITPHVESMLASWNDSTTPIEVVHTTWAGEYLYNSAV